MLIIRHQKNFNVGLVSLLLILFTPVYSVSVVHLSMYVFAVRKYLLSQYFCRLIFQVELSFFIQWVFIEQS